MCGGGQLEESQGSRWWGGRGGCLPHLSSKREMAMDLANINVAAGAIDARAAEIYAARRGAGGARSWIQAAPLSCTLQWSMARACSGRFPSCEVPSSPLPSPPFVPFFLT